MTVSGERETPESGAVFGRERDSKSDTRREGNRETDRERQEVKRERDRRRRRRERERNREEEFKAAKEMKRDRATNRRRRRRFTVQNGRRFVRVRKQRRGWENARMERTRTR